MEYWEYEVCGNTSHRLNVDGNPLGLIEGYYNILGNVAIVFLFL